jgi:hypothetical protein
MPSAAAIVVALALGACGSSSHSSTTTGPAAQPIPAVAAPAGARSPRAGDIHFAKVQRAAGVTAHVVGLNGIPLSQAVEKVAADLNTFWSGEFAKSNLQWPSMHEVIISSGAADTSCSAKPSIQATDEWYLCDLPGGKGGTFYWPLTWIDQNIDTDPGRVHLSLGMAELWSLQVQNLLGYTQSMLSGKLSKGDWAQEAACLTGTYAASLNNRNLFEQSDKYPLGQFASEMFNVNGVTAPNVTSSQLYQAFVSGFESGDPSSCLSGGSSAS